MLTAIREPSAPCNDVSALLSPAQPARLEMERLLGFLGTD